jgi:hypothetical protein
VDEDEEEEDGEADEMLDRERFVAGIVWRWGGDR